VIALEREITANTADAQRKLGEAIWQALWPRLTVDEIRGARAMLEAILEGLPDLPTQV
jgi:hypothetical protein